MNQNNRSCLFIKHQRSHINLKSPDINKKCHYFLQFFWLRFSRVSQKRLINSMNLKMWEKSPTNLGKSVYKAVKNVNTIISEKIINQDPNDQKKIYNGTNDTLNRSKNLEYRVNAVF